MNLGNSEGNILVVEDDLSIRESLQDALEAYGYNVTTAENGRAGIERLDSLNKPWLVLLDLMMPVMDGRQFLDAVRKVPRWMHLPVVVISANADSKSTVGATAFLKKPADLDDILAAVSMHLGT